MHKATAVWVVHVQPCCLTPSTILPYTLTMYLQGLNTGILLQNLMFVWAILQKKFLPSPKEKTLGKGPFLSGPQAAAYAPSSLETIKKMMLHRRKAIETQALKRLFNIGSSAVLKKQSRCSKSKEDCESISEHQPVKQGDSQCFLLVNNLVRIEGCYWQGSEWVCVFAPVSCKIPNTVFFFFFFFSKRGDTLPSQGIPNALKKYRAAWLTAKHISSHSLLKPLSNYLWCFTHTTTVFEGSLAKFCHLTPELWECAGIKGVRRLLSLVFDSPLELCWPGDKVAWWVGNLSLPAAGLARGAGKVPEWVKTHFIQRKTHEREHTHAQIHKEMWMYVCKHTTYILYIGNDNVQIWLNLSEEGLIHFVVLMDCTALYWVYQPLNITQYRL